MSQHEKDLLHFVKELANDYDPKKPDDMTDDDDWDVQDYAGGNFDDAFGMGEEYGHWLSARAAYELLEKLNLL